MAPLTKSACPVDGARLVLVAGVNAAGDGILRYECPNADWVGPWFTGDPTGEIHLSQLPEVTRSSTFIGKTASGGGTVTQTGRDDTDDQAAVATGLLTSVSRLYGWDPIGGNWDRLRVNAAGELVVTTAAGSPTGRDDTDNQAAVATGLGTTVDRNYIWDSIGANWDRWTGAVTQGGAWTVAATQSGAWTTGRTWTLAFGSDSVTAIQGTSPWIVSGTISQTFTGRDDTDNQAVVATGLQVIVDRNYIWDSVGSNWDRWTGAVTQGTSPWVISGTVTANQGGAWTVAATQSGAWTTGRTWTLASGTDSVTVAQGTSPWVVAQTFAGRDDTDDQAAVATGLQTTVVRNYIWDAVGANWDRWTGAVTIPAGVVVTGEVEIKNDSGNPIPVTGSLAVSADPSSSHDYTLKEVIFELRRNNRLLEILIGETPLFTEHDIESDG